MKVLRKNNKQKIIDYPSEKYPEKKLKIIKCDDGYYIEEMWHIQENIMKRDIWIAANMRFINSYELMELMKFIGELKKN